MTMGFELAQLLTVSQARYDHQQQSFGKVLAEESRLRRELVRLDEMAKTQKGDSATLSEMRAIGADVLWLGWLGRSKTALNMQLARVLAVKAAEQDKVRQAFGKVIALQELIKLQEIAARKNAHQNALSTAIDFSMR